VVRGKDERGCPENQAGRTGGHWPYIKGRGGGERESIWWSKKHTLVDRLSAGKGLAGKGPNAVGGEHGATKAVCDVHRHIRKGVTSETKEWG